MRYVDIIRCTQTDYAWHDYKNLNTYNNRFSASGSFSKRLLFCKSSGVTNVCSFETPVQLLFLYIRFARTVMILIRSNAFTVVIRSRHLMYVRRFEKNSACVALVQSDGTQVQYVLWSCPRAFNIGSTNLVPIQDGFPAFSLDFCRSLPSSGLATFST